MNLCDFVPLYCSQRDVSGSYEHQLDTIAKLFNEAVGVPDLANVSSEMVNQHLRKLRGQAASYRRHVRTHLLVLLRAARRCGHAPNFISDDVMRLRVQDPIPHGWTVAEVHRLVMACDSLRLRPHPRTHIPRRLWWRAYIASRWDTGLDDQSVRSIERDWIPPNGQLTLIRPKTRKAKRVAMRAETLQAIAELLAVGDPTRRMIWPLWGSMESLRKEFKKLLRMAGLRGSLKHIRHSSGSDVERLHPGHGHLHIGDTRQVFERHYLIPGIAGGQPMLPTPLNS